MVIHILELGMSEGRQLATATLRMSGYYPVGGRCLQRQIDVKGTRSTTGHQRLQRVGIEPKSRLRQARRTAKIAVMGPIRKTELSGSRRRAMQRSSCRGSLAWYLLTLAWLGLILAAVWTAEPPKVPDTAAKNGKATPYQVALFVHRLWAITDAVLEQHVAPPTRQEMFLAAARHLCLQTQDPPTRLS